MLRTLRDIALTVLIGSLVMFTGSTGYAQLSTATLSGNVTDKSGAIIPHAQVRITNVDRGIVRNVTSNESGFYTAPNLQPGNYAVKVSAPGFSSLEQKGVTLNVGAQQSLDFPLLPGQVSQTVEVTAIQPVVETSNSTIGATVGQKTVVELPLNGRDWTQLATLQPGVSSVHAQASTTSAGNRGNRGFGDQLTDSGHRPNENTYRVDGININDYSNGAPGSTLGASLGVDAIQEFSVVTTDYTAEYGRTSGAVINAVTKAGTNQVHGSGYIFDRDKVFDARNYFDPATIPPFRRLQFGGSLGGPIRKDKTFLFGDYEGVRQAQSGSLANHILSPAALSGVMCSTPNGTGCTTHTVAIDPRIVPFLSFWKQLNGVDTGPTPGGNGDTDVYLTSGLKVLNENYYTARGDNKFSDKDSVTGTFFYDKAPLSQTDALDNIVTQVLTDRHTITLNESHIFNPHTTNIFRAGWTHVKGLVSTPLSSNNPVASDTSLCTICAPSKLAAAEMVVDGLTNAGGLGYISFWTHNYNSVQVNDDVFYIRGNHTLKFGFAFERMHLNTQSQSLGNGEMVFTKLTNTPNVSGLENFLTDQPEKALLLSPIVRKPVQYRDGLYGGYAQDDWRVNSRFTVNLGLRYEMLTNPTEATNSFELLTNFFTSPAPTQYNNEFQNNPTTKNFDPRIGFAWDVFGNGKTAVRAGIGIFDLLPLPYLFEIGNGVSLPFSLAQGVGSASNPLPQGSFPVIPPSVSFGDSTGVRYIDRSPKRSYATNWNLNVEQELTSRLGLFVGYVGSRTLHAPFTADDSNQVIPQKINGVYTWPCAPSGTNPCAAVSDPVANPNVGFIRAIFFDDAISYEGVQTQLKLHDFHSLQAQASYTYSTCTDMGSGSALGDPFLNSITSLMFFDKAHRQGPCDYDLRQVFSANYIWTIPTPHWNKAAELIAGGWQTGAIASVSSGVPFTLVLAGDVLGQNYTDGGYDYPNRVPGCNPIHGGVSYVNTSCFVAAPVTNGGLVLGNNGRNSLNGPGTLDVDFSVFKNMQLRDRLHAQFRAEFFNFLNHTNLQAPVDNYTLGVSGAGQVDQTSTTSRQIQFGAKVTF
jgi:Carboxypeptidase regulatory-like domain